MHTKVITIGNSKGIRIPKYILDNLKIENELDLIVDENKDEIILKPIREPRSGWKEKFIKMHGNQDDKLLIDDNIDFDDWEW